MIFSTPAEDVKTRLSFAAGEFSVHPRNARRKSEAGAEILAAVLVESSESVQLYHNVILSNDRASGKYLITLTTYTNIGKYLFEPLVSWSTTGAERIMPIEQSKWLEDTESGLLFRQVSYETRIPDPIFMVDGLMYCLTIFLPSRRSPSISALMLLDESWLFKVACTYQPRSIQFSFHPLREGFGMRELVQLYSSVREPEVHDPSQFEIPYNGHGWGRQ